MSVRKINVKKTFDSTWEYEVAAGDDKPTAQLSYTDDFNGWASRVPLVNSPHPDIPALKLEKIKAKRIDGGQIKVDLSYVSMVGAGVPGRPAENQNATAKYYLQVSTNEEHILTGTIATELDQVEREALLAISNGNLAAENGVLYKDQITSDTGLNILSKIEKGNTHYKTGSLIYGVRKVVKSLGEIDFPSIGRIKMPPGEIYGAANNWLYLSASADPVNTDEKAWQVDMQWLYSPDGWDEDIYSPPEPA